MKHVSAFVAAVLVLALLLAGCGRGPVDAGPLEPGDDPAVDDPGTDVPPADDDTASPAPDEDEPPADDGPAPADDDADDDRDEPADEPDTPGTTAVRLYFLAPGGDTPARSSPFLVAVQREIPSTPRIALATLRQLVDGPSTGDAALVDDVSTAVPDRTLVLDVTIHDGLATVDLSREFESGGGSLSMFARLAQIVYTVTQFPTVDEVQFELDGRPVTVFSGEGIVLDQPVSRDDYLDLLPTVFVDAPAAGATVGEDVRLTGMAAVFEATFQYRVEGADGRVLDEGFAMTDNGTGWGAFDVTLHLDVAAAQDGRIVVWEYSAKDGSVQAERVTPVRLVP